MTDEMAYPQYFTPFRYSFRLVQIASSTCSDSLFTLFG